MVSPTFISRVCFTKMQAFKLFDDDETGKISFQESEAGCQGAGREHDGRGAAGEQVLIFS